MAHVQKRQRMNKDGTPGAVLWCLRYVNPETGRERTETFRLKRDAERRLTEIEASKLTGSYVDPRAGKVTVGVWAERWLDVQVQLKATTQARYRSILDVHIIPRWGETELAKVRHSDVQKWVADLSSELAPATVRKIHRVLSQVLGSAVKDGRLVRNVAEGIALPRVRSKERLYLTHEQVSDLADACAAVPVSKYASTTEADRGAYRLLVLFLAYTGLRWGELAGLRVGRLDLMRRRASIVETYVVVDGHVVPSDPKNHERREVPMPRFLIDELAAHVAGKAPDALVFGGEKAGTPMRSRTFQRAVFDEASAAVGLDGLTPHALRHTAASLAIAAGADVKVVQQMLGHKSATMTLDLYGHLFPDRLDTVADAMDAARTVALNVAAEAGTGRRRDTAAVVPLRR
ncbi:site-specific integrase [Nocardioides immobilis]|uniref:Site-specific integrase n=1 Tax=Nocardioides immobilis TaxID=2049295 RepID=A0A417Y0X0_9ACTN|nr:tyrosine-type recombinase/integrase [Nocardioides immobilis]RHW26302.1 site-specific integrase [Nocardioides immobilis]